MDTVLVECLLIWIRTDRTAEGRSEFAFLSSFVILARDAETLERNTRVYLYEMGNNRGSRNVGSLTCARK